MFDDGYPAPPENRAQPPPNFWPMSIVAKLLDGSRCHLVWSLTEVILGPGDVVLDGVAVPPKRGAASSFRFMSIMAKLLDG